ncbi:MAG TPA: hypothetical protein VGC42_31315, partial [Kofleriaceae bacterium]
VVWAPRGPLAEKMFKAPSASVADKVEAARPRLVEKRKNGTVKVIPIDNTHALPYQAAMRMVECGSAPDGTAALSARAARALTEKLQGNAISPVAARTLAWAVESGLALPPNTTLKLIR